MMIAGRKILLVSPRLLLIIFALFLVIFSFDVFEEGKSAYEMGIGFVMHNIPSLILGLIVFTAWRREWIGALACLLLANAWTIWAWGRFPVENYFLNYFFMSGPLFLVATLYAANWRLRSKANRSN